MKATIGWLFMGLSLVCAAVCFWMEVQEWKIFESVSFDETASHADDMDARLHKKPRFVVAVILGLLFGGVGMYLIGLFGD